ncbi:MAG TPA: glycosyltransferase family 2 protein [Syntrophorhabdaceae bacterium]|nr:glycosyltransferase family 2 protein [Syntrophorhabdaceae bacterium]
MNPVTIISDYGHYFSQTKQLMPMNLSRLVSNIILVSPERLNTTLPKVRLLEGTSFLEGRVLNYICEIVDTDYILFLTRTNELVIDQKALEVMIDMAEKVRAGIVYCDFYEENKNEKKLHPLNDYQPGSIRDDFDFGAMMLFSTKVVKTAIKKYGAIPPVRYGGLYDIRLKVSIDNPIYHIKEPLYSVIQDNKSSEGKSHFAYVDPKNTHIQKEMESVFTDYLRKIGAFIPYERLKRADKIKNPFPVVASVIIPVKNRKNTIIDAIKSALSQKTDFPFNIIVVDNHSQDGTTFVISSLVDKHPDVKHIIPIRTDLGIGGCWNEAVYSPYCGRYAVQLDSDDLYSSPYTLQKIVDMLMQGSYAMVIGSYCIVNYNLEEIPPGLIDHREWTDENGHNNALRINGLGAPRAFDTDIVRKIGFLNVSYGKDYALALRICREYKIGRIFENLYLCRRWYGNTDASLSIEDANRNDAFKDKVRTDEILARQALNKRLEG